MTRSEHHALCRHKKDAQKIVLPTICSYCELIDQAIEFDRSQEKNEIAKTAYKNGYLMGVEHTKKTSSDAVTAVAKHMRIDAQPLVDAIMDR